MITKYTNLCKTDLVLHAFVKFFTNLCNRKLFLHKFV